MQIKYIGSVPSSIRTLPTVVIIHIRSVRPPSAKQDKSICSRHKVSYIPDVVTQVRERLFNEPGRGSPEAFRKFIEKDLAKWTELGKFVKLKD